MERGHPLPNPYTYNLILVTSDGLFHKGVSGDQKNWKKEAFHIVNNFAWVECVDETTDQIVIVRTTDIVRIYPENLPIHLENPLK